MWMTALQLRKRFKLVLVSEFLPLLFWVLFVWLFCNVKSQDVHGFSFLMRTPWLLCFLCHCQGPNHLEKPRLFKKKRKKVFIRKELRVWALKWYCECLKHFFGNCLHFCRDMLLWEARWQILSNNFCSHLLLQYLF